MTGEFAVTGEKESLEKAERSVFQRCQYLLGKTPFERLAEARVDVSYTHPQGEWNGSADLSAVRYDVSYCRQALIPHKRRVTDYAPVINATLQTLSEEGGGTLIIPEGEYYVSALRLPSHTCLRLDPFATLRFIRSNEEQAYPLTLRRVAGYDCLARSPLISIENAGEVALTGTGLIDGRASLFDYHPVKYGLFGEPCEAQDLKRLRTWASEGVAPLKRVFPVARGTLRPPLIGIRNAHHVSLDGLKLRHSPWHVIDACDSHHLRIKSLEIGSLLFDNDALTLNNCQKVSVEETRFKISGTSFVLEAGGETEGHTENFYAGDNLVEGGCAVLSIGPCLKGSVDKLQLNHNHYLSPDAKHLLKVCLAPGASGKIGELSVDGGELRGTEGALIDIDLHTGRGAVRFDKLSVSHLHSAGDCGAGAALKVEVDDASQLGQLNFEGVRLYGVRELCPALTRCALSLREVFINGREVREVRFKD